MPTFSVDDRDPSVVYLNTSSSWGQYNADPAYDTTVTWLTAGGIAQISFVGSSIRVHGTNYVNAPNRPAFTYTIDDSTPVRLTSNPTAIDQWGELFFQSPDLPNTAHVLTINYDDNSKDSLVLDYFTINDGTLPSDPSSSLTTSILSSTTTIPSTTPNSRVLSPSSLYSMESSPSSPTTSVSVQGKSESKVPIGPIIGGALGGALLFICTVFLILYFRRKRREGHSYANIGASLLPIWRQQITPYDISQPPQHGGRGKSVVNTRSRMMRRATIETTTSSFVAGTSTASFGSMNNLDGMLPITTVTVDPPPSYRPR